MRLLRLVKRYWIKLIRPKMKIQGYTGRKLGEYTWIPKSKTYLREYREFLKICYDLEKSKGYFNDRLVGEEMVKRRAIVDRDNTSDSYIEKYEKKTIGNQSYVSNARMMIRICRWLGWMTKSEGDAKFNLTPYGINLTKFSGPFPSKIADLNEYDLISRAFAKLKFYSVNDSPQYRNPKFKQRVFLNMLKVLSYFDHCSHYELVVSAFVLKDERNEKEFEGLIKRVERLKSGGITIGTALKECNLECKDRSTVTGVYDGPKVMLSFARQLGLVENIPVNKDRDPKTYEEYYRMYNKSGYIKPNGIKYVSKITQKGMEFLKKHLNKSIVWFDELDDKLNETAILIFLNKTDKLLNKKNFKQIKLDDAIQNLEKKGFIEAKKGNIKLKIKTDFDLYQDVPYDARPYVIGILKKFDRNFLDYYDEAVDRMDIQELFVNRNTFSYDRCVYCANPLCKTYPEFSNQYGASDRFADRVCPVDIIKLDEEGKISIDKDKCIGCMLCILRCPFQAISLKNSEASLNLSTEYIQLFYKDKIKATKELIGEKGRKTKIQIAEIKNVIANFDKKIKIPGEELKKDGFYVCVRNFFRAFGFLATYSGSGGMKTRSDVTMLEPHLITSEVKSPAEGPINLKAIRQAFGAAVQLGTQITLAIGGSTHKGAIEEEEKYRKVSPQVKICLLEIKYLMFLYLIQDHLKIDANKIKVLLGNNPGYFNKDKLLTFIKNQVKESKVPTNILNEIIKQASQI